MLKDTPSIVEFVSDTALLGLSISPAQETLLRAIYGLPLSDDQLELFRGCTRREKPFPGGYSEVTCLSGARGGKDSRIAAPIVCYEAVFGNHEKHLGKGERGVIPLVAQDGRAAKIAFNYIKDYLLHSKLLAPRVAEVLANEIELTNGLRIVCFPCTQSSLRGWSIPVAVLDELAFFRLEGQADSDAEIQASIRRGMIAFPSTRLVKISTPYMRSGVLYSDFKDYFGQDSEDVLVWRAPTTLMNPTIKETRLEKEKAKDPERYAREYEAEFAEDLTSFLSSTLIEDAVIKGRRELGPLDGVNYIASTDPTGGGTGQDRDHFSFNLVHVEGKDAQRRVVQDVCRSWRSSRTQTVDLEGIVAQIAAICRNYRVKEIWGDKYARAWVQQSFERQGIKYKDCPDRSTCYLETEALFLQGKIDILDHAELQRELKTLEKRPHQGGKIKVNHAPGNHDDHANALAVACWAAITAKKRLSVVFGRDSYDQTRNDRGVNERGRRIPGTNFYDVTPDNYTGFARGERSVDAEVRYIHRHGPEECSEPNCTKPDRSKF